MRHVILSGLSLSFAVLLVSCNGGGNMEAEVPDGLSDAELATLETIPPHVTEREELRFDDGTDMLEYLASLGISFPSGSASALRREQAQSLPAGLTPQERLTALVAIFTSRAAYYACGRTGKCLCLTPPCNNPWDKQADGNDPDGKPKQTAIGYVSAADNPEARTDPQKAGSICKQQLYGLDCSGLVKRIAADAGLVIGKHSSVQAKIKTWTDAIPPEWGISVIKVSGQYLKGDIIYWAPPSPTESGHIGIVTSSGSNPIVISSVGGTNRCEYNLKSGGPNAYSANTIRTTPPTYALRFVVAGATFTGEFHGTGSDINGNTITSAGTIVGTLLEETGHSTQWYRVTNMTLTSTLFGTRIYSKKCPEDRTQATVDCVYGVLWANPASGAGFGGIQISNGTAHGNLFGTDFFFCQYGTWQSGPMAHGLGETSILVDAQYAEAMRDSSGRTTINVGGNQTCSLKLLHSPMRVTSPR